MTSLVPLREAAKLLGYKQAKTLTARARRGTLPIDILRDGSRLVVRRSDLAAYMEGLSVYGGTPKYDPEIEALRASVLSRL